ncbi:cysteine protease XCP2-like [Curcuma longa]|uniref:cysteine protease XCP2-like n=1 Tax=Curcuma longa TaxID=136217 RepID=UPI003D9F50C5
MNIRLSVLLFLIFFTITSCGFAISSRAKDFGYSSADLASEETLLNLFHSWAATNNKPYLNSPDTKSTKFEVFKDNLNHIVATNKRRKSHWLGLNAFADMAHDEFKRNYLGFNPKKNLLTSTDHTTSKIFMYENVTNLPKSIDWRRKGAVTPVKNQGGCGSCWAFSTVAAMEGINQVVTGNLTSLSEQELIDCDIEFDEGCSGGTMDYAFASVVAMGGLRTEQDYPYTMEEGSCQPAKGGEAKRVSINGYEDVPKNSEESLLKALAHQPVSIAIEGSDRDLQFYKGGVFEGPCGTELDHGVTAVGYGTTFDGRKYILVKNSWGPEWGEQGFIRMRRNTGNVEGLCGMYKMASYPTKTKPY